ncbi:uncharacterized mitochondrial protein AtMg00860-like [Arachis hypogaea]|uniref:uncharacterized mitochondrial protein AtMg00860-like n=1 Tax=Arachis hypogaea TaxID=3818 RepID=UPI003B214830
MVNQGIVVCLIVSSNGISVDPAKVEVVFGLPYSSFVRKVCTFLSHAGFYRRFIKNFSKVALPLSHLLQKDIEFDFNEAYIEAFDTLKHALTKAPIVRGPNWSSPFKIMCDTFNHAVGPRLHSVMVRIHML